MIQKKIEEINSEIYNIDIKIDKINNELDTYNKI